MSTIGKNIKKKRNEKGITQDQLAEKLNVARQTVSSWEMGRTEPDVDTLTKLAEVLDVTEEDLIYDDQPEKAQAPAASVSKGGIGFGCALAMIISYTHWYSIGWAILHGLLNWVYVIYYIIKY